MSVTIGKELKTLGKPSHFLKLDMKKSLNNQPLSTSSGDSYRTTSVVSAKGFAKTMNNDTKMQMLIKNKFAAEIHQPHSAIARGNT